MAMTVAIATIVAIVEVDKEGSILVEEDSNLEVEDNIQVDIDLEGNLGEVDKLQVDKFLLVEGISLEDMPKVGIAKEDIVKVDITKEVGLKEQMKLNYLDLKVNKDCLDRSIYYPKEER